MRALWVMAMIAGTIIFGLLSAWALVSFGIRASGAEITLPLFDVGPWTGVTFFLASGTCAGAAFYTPAQIREVTKEPEPPKAKWLEEYQREREEERQRSD